MKLNLSVKQRWTRAKREYFKAQVDAYNFLKHRYMLNDEEMESALEGWSEPGPVQQEWESMLEKAQSTIENKYMVWIEHEDDYVRIKTWGSA